MVLHLFRSRYYSPNRLLQSTRPAICKSSVLRESFSFDPTPALPASGEGVIASEAKQSLPPALSQDWEKSCLPGGRQGVRTSCLNCPGN